MIEGTLYVSHDDAFISMGGEKSHRIRIIDPLIRKKMLGEVPVHLGVEFYYCDPSSMLVVVDIVGDDIVISDIISGTVEQYSGNYSF